MNKSLRPMRAATLRILLIEKAKSRQVTFYGQWMKFFDIDRFELAEILGKTVEIDKEMGTPPVASLVVRKDSLRQGAGFAAKVTAEGLVNSGAHASQLEVFNHYANQGAINV